MNYLTDNPLAFAFVFFKSGEDLILYCQEETVRIDILFLDIEMTGISGIEVKDQILRQDMVWRIVFVSSHKERVFDSFGLKTLDFIVKPALQKYRLLIKT